MCGIAGILGERGTSAEASAANMAAAISHRGPDDSGVWADHSAGIAFGHARLAVLDLSPAGHQPMLSACGRYVLVFNGEIYNHGDLAKELQDAGQRLRGHSDTEIFLEYIARFGFLPTLEKCNGMFAFALWDRTERKLYLARDRFGEKPLYYGWFGDVFLFGSELKALRAHPRYREQIDRASLRRFLQRNYIPAPHSIVSGVRKLMPGTYLVLGVDERGAYPQPTSYWSAWQACVTGMHSGLDRSIEEEKRSLHELLGDAVRRRLVADVPLGALLSGGIDSSLIVALMQEQGGRAMTFTIGFGEEGFDEAAYARRVANHLGTEHTELYVSADQAREVIPELPGIYDEPFADSSQIPTLLVSRLARRHVTVALSGDGGDELFGGYWRHFLAARLWPRLSLLPGPARSVFSRLLMSLPPRHWDRLLKSMERWLPVRYRPVPPGDRIHKFADMLAARSAGEMYRQLTSFWTSEELDGMGLPDDREAADSITGMDELGDMAEQMMYLDTVDYLPGDILTKVDRASMSVALEIRVPFLDHRVMEQAWRLPLSMKIRDGRGKWILHEILREYVPDSLMERSKMGFAVPIDSWLRGPLRDWAEDLLAERRLRDQGYLNPAPIRRKWEEHLAGQRNWQHALWGVLMFQAWLEAR